MPTHKNLLQYPACRLDEGGIVKLPGDNLVILRADAFLRSGSATIREAVDTIDAFAPGVNPSMMYDESLSGDTVVVIG